MDQTVRKILNEKIGPINKQEKMDLSSDLDLSKALINLTSLEEHFFVTDVKTENAKYFGRLNETRSIRKDLLIQIINDYEGEAWYIYKFLLSASMRLMEVGTKQLSMGNNEEAKVLFEKACGLYCLFCGINMNVIDTIQHKKIDDKALNKHEETNGGFFDKLGERIKKAIDCHIE
ncbi:MAG TPA: hypothetical protein DGG95_05560 [Cytophagales bacterium]|nr:hypothetical protein [Cytophagales bacterium]